MLSVLFDPAGKPLLALDLIIGRGTAVYMMVSVRENFYSPSSLIWGYFNDGKLLMLHAQKRVNIADRKKQSMCD